MTYSSATAAREFERLADGITGPVTAGVHKILKLWNAGIATDADLQGMLIEALMTTNAYSRGAAELLAVHFLHKLTGETVAVGGSTAVTVAAERDRLTKAVATALGSIDEAEDLTMRLTRLAVAEATAAMQEQLTHSYARNGVDGYTRGLDSNACELCMWLYKDGYVYPMDKPFHRHPGCKCTPIPVKGTK